MKFKDAQEEQEWWSSLTDAERESHAVMTDERMAESDRRWAEHLADPGSAIPWEEIERRQRSRQAP